MNNIDLQLLEKFQKVSDFFQVWFGITNFKLARISLVLCLTFRIVENILAQKSIEDLGWLIISWIVFLLVLVYFIYNLRQAENSSANPVFRNQLVVKFAIFRQVFLFIFVSNILLLILMSLFSDEFNENDRKDSGFLVSIVFSILSNFFELLFLYFASCTPKPFKPSRIKRILSKISESLSQKPEESLVPN